MDLRDIGSSLPPGFRFYPSDEELVCHYLYKKIANEEIQNGTLMEINLHTCEPWQLPEVAKLNSCEWYFFSFRDRKYSTGFRTNRSTATGYWKATGKDRTIYHTATCSVVGMRKTLVFYKNRAPNGFKTGWIMHEFRLENPHMSPEEDWVLCRVFHKGKGENINELSPQYEYNCAISITTSPFCAASPSTHQTFPCGHNQTIPSFSQNPPYQSQNSSTNPIPSLINPNAFQLSRQIIDNPAIELDSKCDDGYGSLFYSGFEESSVGDGAPTN